jgi:hypothetical protein
MIDVLMGTHYFGDNSIEITTHLIDAGESRNSNAYSLVPLDLDMTPLGDDSAIEVTVRRPEFVRAIEALIEADMRDMGELS